MLLLIFPIFSTRAHRLTLTVRYCSIAHKPQVARHARKDTRHMVQKRESNGNHTLHIHRAGGSPSAELLAAQLFRVKEAPPVCFLRAIFPRVEHEPLLTGRLLKFGVSVPGPSTAPAKRIVLVQCGLGAGGGGCGREGERCACAQHPSPTTQLQLPAPPPYLMCVSTRRRTTKHAPTPTHT